MVDSNGRFVWYELLTTDVEMAKSFYADVVGWGTRDASMPGLAYSLFTLGDVPVTGLMSLPAGAMRAGATPHWIGYVGVDDLDAAIGRLEQLGGSVRVPATDVPGISRFSIVSDPQMTTLALVEGVKPGREPSVHPGTPGHVGWHELLAVNWAKAFDFYGELLGWQKASADLSPTGTYQQFSIGGETIGGMFSKPAALPPPFWRYYFNTADIEAAAQRVQAGGGEILYGPNAVKGGALIVHCMDPQGATFALLNRPSRKAVGYFVPSGEPPAARGR